MFLVNNLLDSSPDNMDFLRNGISCVNILQSEIVCRVIKYLSSHIISYVFSSFKIESLSN